MASRRPLPPNQSGVRGVADADASDADVAILVCHGMGQQVHFETLEDIVRCLKDPVVPDVSGSLQNVTYCQVGETRLPRADVRLTDTRPGKSRDQCVHLYEAWWAPLTEGKIGLGEVVTFLFRAAYDGIRTVRAGKRAQPPGFERYLFGEPRQYPTGGHATVRRLLAVALVLVALIFLNLVVGLVTSASVLTPSGTAWPPLDIVSAITWDVLLIGLGGGGLLGLVAYLGRSHRVAIAALAVVVVTAALVASRLIHGSDCFPRWNLWLTEFPRVVVAVPWLILLGVSWYAKGLVVQYLGDVAIYVQSHRVNRFYETRQAMKECALVVARAVYAQRYRRVIVVGHSLGSVIAYDTLNTLVNDDDLGPGPFRDVVQRTAALVTFGSPLDKTAFLFRSHVGRDAPVRERLAAMAQPLIQDYRLRPGVWLNIFAPADWISGQLDFYDPPVAPDFVGPPDPWRVRNIVDPDATRPLAAHTAYWKNPCLARLLQLAVLDEESTGPRIPTYAP